MTKTTSRAIIEDGWNSYLNHVVPKDAPPIQVKETKQAFYSGASVLFYKILNILDPGEEPTEKDLMVMDDIKAEIDRFGERLDKDVLGLDKSNPQ